MVMVFIENRKLNDNVALTWDIAHHLYTRAGRGVVVIVAERPSILLPALRKQWIKVEGKIRKEYSATLDPQRKEVIGQTIQHMEDLKFTAKFSEPKSNQVYIIKPSDVIKLNRPYHTLYITCQLDTKTRELLLEGLVRLGVVVEYQEPVLIRHRVSK